MPKVVGTRERVHQVFYESFERERLALAAAGLALYFAGKNLPRRKPVAVRGDREHAVASVGAYRQAAPTCRTCGAPRRDAMTCDYCDRAYT